MNEDGIITYDAVAQGLSPDVRRALLLAMPPQQRGWYTRAEMEASDGRFVEMWRMDEAEPRYLRLDR